MNSFATTGRFDVAQDILDKAHELFSGFRLDDEGIVAEIQATQDAHGMVLDPHSAVGVAAARDALKNGLVDAETPVVALACAHPAKFPDAVARATGQTPELPQHLADLMSRPEQMATSAVIPPPSPRWSRRTAGRRSWLII